MSALALCDSLFFSYMILEILTLATYLLVGFWFNQPLVVTGARDAFLTKRVGDLLLLMGVLAIWHFVPYMEFHGVGPMGGSAGDGGLCSSASAAHVLVGAGVAGGAVGEMCPVSIPFVAG